MSSGPRFEFAASETGAYRIEIQLPNAPGNPPIPWVVTNPIYLRADAKPPAEKGSVPSFTPRYQDGPADGWSVEKSAQSRGAIDVVPTISGKQLKFRFALGGSDAESPFVAFVMSPGPITGNDRMTFNAMASRPMRISVQVRSTGAGAERWRRSVYLDETMRTVTVRFDDMHPMGPSDARVSADRVRDVLFVVDRTNARLGSNGEIWIDDVKYGR
jgi:hypothetical protein